MNRLANLNFINYFCGNVAYLDCPLAINKTKDIEKIMILVTYISLHLFNLF